MTRNLITHQGGKKEVKNLQKDITQETKKKNREKGRQKKPLLLGNIPVKIKIKKNKKSEKGGIRWQERREVVRNLRQKAREEVEL